MTKYRTHLIDSLDLTPTTERMRSSKPHKSPSAYWRAKRNEVKARRVKRSES